MLATSHSLPETGKEAERQVLRPLNEPDNEIFSWDPEASVVVVHSGYWFTAHGADGYELLVAKGTSFKEHEL